MAAGDDILAKHETLRDRRRPEEAQWRDIAALLRPDERDFDVAQKSDVDMSEIYDASPLYALDNFVGGLFGQAINPANRWMELGLEDEDLEKWGPVRENLYARTNRLYASIPPAVSTFYSEAPAWLGNLGAFGWGVMSQEERVGKGKIVDRALPIGQCYIEVDGDGEINTFHREYRLRGHQVLQEFGPVGSVPIDEKREYTIVHRIAPNRDFEPGRLGLKGMPFSGTYVSPEIKDMRVEGGYFELPQAVPTWTGRPGRDYPIGPGHLTRSDAKMLQEMERSHIVAAQFAAEPVTLLSSDSVLTAADIVPSAVLIGTLSEQGKRLADRLDMGKNVGLSIEQSQRRRDAIATAFYFSIMQLINRPQMTATEFLGFQEENLKLIAPHLIRVQTGGLAPFIGRRHAILERAGQMPPAPPELQGKLLKINFVSPLAKAMKAAQGRAVLQLHQGIEQFAITDPSARDNFDVDVASRVLGDAFTEVPGLLRDPKIVAERRRERAELQAKAAELEAAGQQVSIAAEAAHARQAETLARRRVN